jgi:hypothetical protein
LNYVEEAFEMVTPFYERLKRVHEFDDWRGQNGLAENLTIWRFLPEFAIDEPWRTERTSQFAMPDGRRAMQSLWHRGDDAPRVVVRISMVECETRVAAHEALIGLLGEVESPLISRSRDTDIGDVMFAGPEDTVVAFARANLVALIQSADRQIAPLGDLARLLDRELSARPEPSDSVRAVASVRAPVRRVANRATVPLEVDIRADLGERVYYKFLAASGEVVLEEGRPVYRAARPGRDEVSAYVVVPGVGASVERLTMDVENFDSGPPP